MTQNKQTENSTEHLTILTANQNYFTRSVVIKIADFIATLFIAIIVIFIVTLIDSIIITIALTTQKSPTQTLIITAAISAPIALIAIITPIHCFKTHRDEIEELHQRYTDTETVVLKEYLEKPTSINNHQT